MCLIFYAHTLVHIRGCIHERRASSYGLPKIAIFNQNYRTMIRELNTYYTLFIQQYAPLNLLINYLEH